MSIGSDFVGVSNIFNNSNINIIASIFDSPDVFELIVNKDHGIKNVSDLKGKKVGLTKKTTGEFFLGTFLASNDLSINEMEQVDGEPQVLLDMLSKGEIDAVITFFPHVYNIKQKMGDSVQLFKAQENQSLYSSLYGKQEFIQNHPDTIARFVRSLAQAEQFMKSHPDDVNKFFTEHFNYSSGYISDILSQFNFRLSLSQAMILAMEDEARWSISKKLTDKNKIPNYFNMIYFKALDQVKPEAVSIIH
jgi:NitT/TauT family transport system substrate-binding protein